MTESSPLQEARASYAPKLPPVLAENGPFVACEEGETTQSAGDQEAIRAMFPNSYGLPVVTFGPGERGAAAPVSAGVILSGGQAPGGHNVIAGLFDGLKALHPDSQLYGFLGGPKGLIVNKHKLLTGEVIDEYRNTGGFDIIGSGRDKLEKTEDFESVIANCRALGITALVVIGGDDSNTNACMLAEYIEHKQAGIRVIGCPKTIDGDLKNDQIEISFGFDTATKVYSELIGNIERDSKSARKYWHFVKLMGRSASHITLECALQTQPNAALVSEEVASEGQTLNDIVEHIGGVVRDRAAAGKNFGVVLIPEGLVEFIPEMKALITELNELLAENDEYFKSLPTTDDQLQFVNSKLSPASSQAFSSLPGNIQMQLLMDRDAHGNVQVSRIETEKLVVNMLQDLLREWKAKGEYDGKFSTQTHFIGYEGRCAAPSNFDADYCYSLGYAAAALIASGKTGYMASVRNLASPTSEWVAGGIPLTMMMNLERRHGKDVPVIRKALVGLTGRPFAEFAAGRDAWALEEHYVYPGPIQYFGPSAVCDRTSMTLALERG